MVQPDDPISFMQLTAKNEMNSKEDQFQLSLLAAMGNTQRKEAADPLASKLNKVTCSFVFYSSNFYYLPKRSGITGINLGFCGVLGSLTGLQWQLKSLFTFTVQLDTPSLCAL